MKSLIAAAVFGAVCLTAHADPIAYGVAADYKPRAMLYVTKSFGQRDGRTLPLSFGLRLEQPVPASFSAGSHLNSNSRLSAVVPMLDLGFRAGGGYQMSLNGAMMLDSTGSTEGSWDQPWLWLGVAAVLIGGSCATDNWPCESDKKDSYEVPDAPVGLR